MKQKTRKAIRGASEAAVELLIWFGVGTAAFFAVYFLLRYVGLWD